MTTSTTTSPLAAATTAELLAELYNRPDFDEATIHDVPDRDLAIGTYLNVARNRAIMLRVAALLDAVDRHPVARRWLGLP